MTDLVDALVSSINKNQDAIQQSHIEDIKSFDRSMTLRGLRETTRKHQIGILIKYALFLKKPFNKATKQDVESYLSDSNGGKPKGSTINIYQALLKRFYKTITGEVPECVAWFQKNYYKTPRTKPSDLLTEEDIKNMVDSCVHERNKLIVSILYDTAARVGELCDMNVGDIVNRTGQLYANVDGKTGIREIELILSAAQMTQYLNNHPYKHKNDAPLLLSFDHRDELKRISVHGVAYTVKHVAKRAGIQKKVTPHIFRKSRITSWVRMGIMEMELRYLAGWSPESDMPATYVRLAPTQINQKRRRLETGEKPKQVECSQSILLPIVCPRCSTKNDASNKYCTKCWLPINQASANRDTRIINTFRTNWIKLIKGIDVDSICNEFYQWQSYVQEMNEFHEAFKSNDTVDINLLRERLDWNKSKFNRLMESLLDFGHIKVDTGRIKIVKFHDNKGNEKSIFENFSMLNARYLKSK